MKLFLAAVFALLCSLSHLFAQDFEQYRHLLDTNFHSEALGFSREISVTVPQDWQPETGKRFPLTIVFDRQNPRSHGHVLRTIDYLSSTDQMPGTVVLSIASEPQHRRRETQHKASSPEGQLEQNVRFLFEELIPYAESELHAGDFRMFIGHSRYGYFCTALFLQHPERLNATISASPFFFQKNVNLIDSLALLDGKVLPAHRYHRFSIGNDYPEDQAAMEQAMPGLNHPQVDFKGWYFPRAGHNATPGIMISQALYEIFEEYARQSDSYLAENNLDGASADSLMKQVEAHYGSHLPFSLGILNGKGWFFYNQESYAEAAEAWKIMVREYPAFAEGYLYLYDALARLGKPDPELLLTFERELARSPMYSEADRRDWMEELKALRP